MVFESPIWLLGLLPWAAIVIYLMPGKGRAQAVPFLNFWRGANKPSRATAWRIPPVSVVLILTALLLAVLAAAQPARVERGISGNEISIILDRGVSMARPSVSGEPFRGAIRRCAEILGRTARVTLVPVPGEAIETAGDGWVAAAKAMSPTVVQTDIEPVIAERLRETPGPVFVMTDRRLSLVDPRVVQIVPDEPAPCVAITATGARLTPRSQVMVRLENQSDRKSVQLKVRSGKTAVEQTVLLPSRGQSVDHFVDLDNLDDVITAEIDSDPARNPWARAFLVRRTAGINIVADRSLPNSVQRMITVYSRDRQGDVDAKPVIVSTQRLDNEQAGIWLAPPSPGSSDGAQVVTMANALTKNVTTWPTAGGGLAAPPGFLPVVSLGKIAVIAMREHPARQLWLNVEMTDWERTSDFVIFFGNAFDWFTSGDGRYASTNGPTLGITWPGAYRDEAGRWTAVNAGPYPKTDPPSVATFPSSLAAAGPREPFGSWVLLAALGCLVISVFNAKQS